MNKYTKAKEEMQKHVPWIKEINIDQFSELVEDLHILTNNNTNLQDVYNVICRCIAHKLIDNGDVTIVTSLDEAEIYKITDKGTSRILRGIASYELGFPRFDGFDLYLLFIFLVQTDNPLNPPNNEIKELCNKIVNILKSYGMVIVKNDRVQ